MKREILHVVHNNPSEKWEIKKAGCDFVSASAELKAEAIKLATSMAKSYPFGQVKIHGLDGKIKEEHTYGKDPKRYLG